MHSGATFGARCDAADDYEFELGSDISSAKISPDRSEPDAATAGCGELQADVDRGNMHTATAIGNMHTATAVVATAGSVNARNHAHHPSKILVNIPEGLHNAMADGDQRGAGLEFEFELGSDVSSAKISPDQSEAEAATGSCQPEAGVDRRKFPGVKVASASVILNTNPDEEELHEFEFSSEEQSAVADKACYK